MLEIVSPRGDNVELGVEVHKAGGVAVYELLIAMTLLGMASLVSATTNMATTPPAATTTTKNLNK